jgi:cation diffusion facilitator CzcD-associated flavoprotein CzcO
MGLVKRAIRALDIRRKHPVSIAVIGAGMGGVSLATRLKLHGIDSFTIFEKNDGPGGTWFENTYPDCGVDVISHLYSFSFLKNYDWKRTHATQPEVLEYVYAIVDKFGLGPHIRYGVNIKSVVWDDATHRYTVTTADGERQEFDVVVGAVGRLNIPNYPTWPGLETFKGPKFHSSRWDHDLDLRGKRVAVVGTGSTSAQIVPAIAPKVGQLYVFQRQPGWVVPKRAKVYSEADRERIRRQPWIVDWRRFTTFLRMEKLRATSVLGSKLQIKSRAAALKFIEDTVHDPQLRAMVTPDYAFYCKRPVISDDFYPALQRDNVQLVPRAVTRVTETGIVDADGVERQIDVLVMSTGFQATRFLGSIELVGRSGQNIHDIWGSEPAALAGVMIPGFPNFYMISGPNSTAGSATFIQETQGKLILSAIKRMQRTGITSIEAREGLTRRFNAWLEREMVNKVYVSSCRNYYRTPSGRVVTQWPAQASMYVVLCYLLRGPFHNFGKVQRPISRKTADAIPKAAATSPHASELQDAPSGAQPVKEAAQV